MFRVRFERMERQDVWIWRTITGVRSIECRVEDGKPTILLGALTPSGEEYVVAYAPVRNVRIGPADDVRRG